MYKFILIAGLFIGSSSDAFAQNWFKRNFPKSAITGQFAGSTGFLSIGYSRITPGDKLDFTLLYGYVPRSKGGVLNSLTIKTTYNPFQFTALKKISIEPIQTGIFVSRTYGDYLGLSWDNRYPQGYYWWTRSVRFHVFLGSQIAYKFDKKHLDRIAAYFEANTNDLYIASYLPNTKALSFYDIIFFGTGLKLYLK